MRERKCRVYDKQNARMEYPSSFMIIAQNDCYILSPHHEESFYEKCTNPDRFSEPMDFTGLKDKNGKEIYECDEMSGEDASGEKIRGVVKFIDGAFLLINNTHFFTQVGHSNHSHTYFRDMASQLEVIGMVIADLKITEE